MKIFIYDESRSLIRTVGTPDVMQGENNATLIFMSVAGIDQSNFQNYLAQFAATIGTSHPADIITDFGPYVLDGVTYYGWKYFVSSKFTQVAGVLNANLVLSSGGSTLISQTVSLNVNPSASGVTWFKNITQAQWEQLLAYCVGLRNPNLGELSAEGLDSYCNMGQAGAYLYVDEGGLSHLLFVGYDEAQDRVYQTDYYNNNGALICRQRYTTEGVEDEWTNWETFDQASAISFNASGLPQLTGANTVQKAIAALAHAVYPIAFVTSLAPAPFTSVDVPNSKDKIIKDDLGQDLNAGGVLDYAFAIFGRYVTHAFDFDNTLIMTSDGAIYRMKYENGSMVAHWFNGSPAQVKSEQALINQTLSDGIATNNNLIKNNVAGMGEITMDSDTYVITLTIKNLNGQVIATSSVDIPAEMAFVSGRYDAEDRDLIFTLQNGNEVAVPVDDIFVGLATQDWVNTAIATALLPYATASWVDSNYMSLTKGGVVNLANPPASGSTFYFGAKNGTTSLFEVSDHAILGKVTGNTGEVWHFNMNGNANSAPIFTHIIPASGNTPTRTTQYKLPLNASTGSHDLVIDDDLDEANAKIASLETKTAKQESDIQYLYRQVIGGGDLVTETDSGVSLTSQPFPLTVSPKALLNYVGGMCKKCENLYSATQTPTSGQTYSLSLPAGTYTISINIKTAGKNAYVTFNKNGVTALNVGWVGGYEPTSPQTGVVSSTFTLTDSVDTIIFYNSTNGVDVDKIMLVRGSTAKAYEPYFEGIKTAPVTKVVSKGFNLFDEVSISWNKALSVQTGTTYDNQNAFTSGFIEVEELTSYYAYAATGANLLYVCYYDKDKRYISGDGWNKNTAITTPSNCKYLRFSIQQYGTTYNHDICINVSNASLNGTYMPWTPPIEYPIPAEVRALEGYGYGLSADCYNEVSYERKSYGKVMRRVDLGSLDWRYRQIAGGRYGFLATVSDIKYSSAKANMSCAKYNAYSINSLYNTEGATGICTAGDAPSLIVFDDAYNDATAFKNAMNGVYLYYELATPVETDISEYIDSDVIVVSAGGFLEFENEDGLGVPYSATYQCEPETQGEGE